MKMKLPMIPRWCLVVVACAAVGGALRGSAAPAPVAHWTFDDGTAADVVGAMDGTLMGGATIANGRLVLNGTDAFVTTAPLGANVAERTLVARVALPTLDQGGGGVITLQTADGGSFDAIVYAERQARKWMSGSENWSRTQDLAGPEETAGSTELIEIAVVYGADNSVAVYRNGLPYGSPYTGGNVRTYLTGAGHVVFGMRHGLTATAGRMLNGEIDEAMLFDRALTPAEVGTLAGLTLFVWRQPENQFAFIGEDATFTVGAEGTAPLGFQWLKGGNPLAGQMASELALTGVQVADAGEYSVVVTNSSGAVTSQVARLSVYYPVENNLVGHWKLDDLGGLITTNATGNDLTGTLVEFPDDNSQWDFGLIEGALGFQGTRRVEIADSPLLRVDSFSAAFWIHANALGFDGTPISKESASHCETWGLELRGSGQLNFFLFNDAGFIADVQSSVNLEVGVYHQVVLVYNHLTSTPDVYLDGALVSGTRGDGPASGPPGYDNSPLTFGRRLGACAYPASFDGFLDDVQMYDKALNSSEVAFLFHNPGTVLSPNVDLPPAITAQPQSRTGLVGSDITLAGTAGGTPPLHYQWFKDDAPVAGATEPELVLTGLQLTDAGGYALVVTNFLGSVTSVVAQVRVVEFGSGLTAKWTFEDGTGDDVVGAMNGTLMGGATIAGGRLLLNGSSAYLETVPLASDISEKTLVAWVALSTLEQGGGAAITLEQGAPGDMFDAIVYAERQPRRWMAGSDFWERTVDVAGPEETAGGGVLVHMAISYRSDNSIAIYRNGQPYGEPYTQGLLQTFSAGEGRIVLGRRHTGFLQGEIEEAALYDRALFVEEIAALFAERSLRWEQEPQDLVAFAGEAGSLTVLASGEGTPTYQWYKDGAEVAGATEATLTWASLQAADSGAYQAVADVGGASLTSRVARVLVRLPEENGLLAHWTFDDGTARDVYGFMHGTLLGGATIVDGRLQLNGTDAYVRTLPLPVGVSSKTLVAWVAVADLNQRGGGVMTLQTPPPIGTGNNEPFDSMTYAEREPFRWMAGSDGWNRSENVGGPDETAGPNDFVLIAVVYHADGSIQIYRNGQPYGTPYTKGSLRTYNAGNGVIVLGTRHEPPGGDRVFAGAIDEARLYDRALTAAEIAAFVGPRLTLARDGDNLTISWPTEVTGYILESSATLPAASWEPVAGVVNNSVTLSGAADARFFRLRQ